MYKSSLVDVDSTYANKLYYENKKLGDKYNEVVKESTATLAAYREVDVAALMQCFGRQMELLADPAAAAEAFDNKKTLRSSMESFCAKHEADTKLLTEALLKRMKP